MPRQSHSTYESICSTIQYTIRTRSLRQQLSRGQSLLETASQQVYLAIVLINTCAGAEAHSCDRGASPTIAASASRLSMLEPFSGGKVQSRVIPCANKTIHAVSHWPKKFCSFLKFHDHGSPCFCGFYMLNWSPYTTRVYRDYGLSG